MSIIALALMLASSQNLTRIGKMVDSRANGSNYNYAPSIVYENGMHHMFTCREGDNTVKTRWDFIGYQKSVSGSVWSPQQVVLKPTGSDPGLHNDASGTDFAACDPSVVKFKGSYYMFYGGVRQDWLGTIYVAKSSQLPGPWQKYSKYQTGALGWMSNPDNPLPVIYPEIRRNLPVDDLTYYTAGQPTAVVMRDTVYVWYTDGSREAGKWRRYLRKLTLNANGFFDVGPQIALTIGGVVNPAFNDRAMPSMDNGEVKYNPDAKMFVWFDVSPSFNPNSILMQRISSDGINWSSEATLGNAWQGSHNIGVSADTSGWLRPWPIGTIIAFGAPWDNLPELINGDNSTPFWDLHGVVWGARTDFANWRPVVYPIPTMGKAAKLVRDYDGDGLADLGVVNKSAGVWKISNSIANSNHYPKGKISPVSDVSFTWAGMNANFAVVEGDFDGDGKADMTIVDSISGKWYSQFSSGKIPFPWGWAWSGQTSGFSIKVGDFDGDNIADRAIMNKSTSEFFVLSSKTSSTGVPGVVWGAKSFSAYTSDMQLQIADFNGDGKDDRAFFKPSTGEWYVVITNNPLGVGYAPFTSGFKWANYNADYIPVVGDFDGDLKADIGYFNKKTAEWHIFYSGKTKESHFYPTMGELSGSTGPFEPVVADYDGDLIADRGVVDQTKEQWYIYPSKGKSVRSHFVLP